MSFSLFMLKCQIYLYSSEGHKELDDKVYNLDPTEDGEASEEPHGAANEAELGL